MTPSRLSPNEVERLATLHAMQVLDTPPEARFDRLTRIATALFDMPIAALTLVDGDRVYFKSIQGFEGQEVPRSVSFCPYTIHEEDTFIVADALADVRFATNPLVVGGPEFRFYGGHPLRAPNGHVVGVFCVLDAKPRTFTPAQQALLRDFAKLAENELNAAGMSRLMLMQVAELEEANGRLSRADRHKDEFLSVISHELRTPLNFIMGFASMLEDELQGGLNDAQHEALGRILVGSDRMLALVDDLLDAARIQAGQLRLRLRDVEVPRVVDEVLASLAPLAARKGLVLTTAIDVPGTVLLDARRFGQVVMNLVANAIKFTPAGTVQVSAVVREGNLRLEVRDEGVGITEEAQAKLFNRFEQGDMSATRQAGGTGLGLAISRAIVEAHAGTIGVESEVGHGAIFRVSVPVAGAAVPTGPAMLAPIPADDAARVAALASLDLVGQPPDPRLDVITRLVAQHFGVAVAAIALIDADRHWTVACYGGTMGRTDRATSMCAHALVEPGALVVPDTHLDPRFAQNLSVTQAPFTRFYVGQRLRGPDGHAIGTLCLCSPQPRAFSAEDANALAGFVLLAEGVLTPACGI